MRFLTVAPLPVASVLAGVLGDAIGLRPTVTVLAAFGLCVAMLALAQSRLRRLNSVPAAPGMVDPA